MKTDKMASQVQGRTEEDTVKKLQQDIADFIDSCPELSKDRIKSVIENLSVNSNTDVNFLEDPEVKKTDSSEETVAQSVISQGDVMLRERTKTDMGDSTKSGVLKDSELPESCVKGMRSKYRSRVKLAQKLKSERCRRKSKWCLFWQVMISIDIAAFVGLIVLMRVWPNMLKAELPNSLPRILFPSVSPSMYQDFFHYYLDRPLRGLAVRWNLVYESFEEMDWKCIRKDTSPEASFKEDNCTCEGVNNFWTVKKQAEGYRDDGTFKVLVRRRIPLVLRNKGRVLSPNDLQEQISRYHIYYSEAEFFQSNINNVTTLQDLADPELFEEAMSNRTTHIIWSGSYISRTAPIRRLFPFPYIFGAMILRKRVLLINGGNGSPYALPYEIVGSEKIVIMYSQGRGSRKIHLMPRRHCVTRCANLSIILREGDILFFNNNCWELGLEPVNDSLSIAALGFMAAVDSEDQDSDKELEPIL